GGAHCHGLHPGAEGTRVVALHRRRSLLQLDAPVVGGALLLLHGHPPVGQVQDGGVARGTRARVDDRRGHLPGGDPLRAHRLRLPAELRCPMDLHPGQGRDELGGCRSVLQPPELRADVQLPRAPASGGRGGTRHRPRAAGPPARCGAAVRVARDRRAAGAAAGTGTAGRSGTAGRPRAASAARAADMMRRDGHPVDADRYREWKGAYRPYDLVKEAVIALAAITVLALVLTILFSSPDERPSTVQSWARTDPVDFVTTATTELDGSSGTAGYGPPYNHASDGQHIAFIYPQKWLGVSHPVDTARDFVLAPLRSIPNQPALQAAVSTYEFAPAANQNAWTSAYQTGLAKA